MPPRKTPRSNNLSRRIVHVQGGDGGDRTVRIAVYEKREGQTTGVTFGLGYGNPNSFSKINFEITPENWLEIESSVREALRIAGHPLEGSKTKPKPKRTRKKKEPIPEPAATEPEPTEPTDTDTDTEPTVDEPAIVPPPAPGQPARRKVGAVRQ